MADISRRDRSSHTALGSGGCLSGRSKGKGIRRYFHAFLLKGGLCKPAMR